MECRREEEEEPNSRLPEPFSSSKFSIPKSEFGSRPNLHTRCSSRASTAVRISFLPLAFTQKDIHRRRHTDTHLEAICYTCIMTNHRIFCSHRAVWLVQAVFYAAATGGNFSCTGELTLDLFLSLRASLSASSLSCHLGTCSSFCSSACFSSCSASRFSASSSVKT